MERDFNREMKISNFITSVENEANSIMDEFDMFTDGMRMLLLLERKKDGGHNNEEKRVFESYVTFNKDEFRDKLKNLLYLKRLKNNNCRIYVSCNSRSQKKVIREMHNAMVEQYYSDDECTDFIQKKLIKNPRHFVMQPTVKETSYFLLDVDNVDGQDVMGEALREIERLNIKEITRYATKNGWHIVVEPFNPSLWNSVGEIKKDPLVLLSF